MPPGLTDWFSAGAAALEANFRAASPDEPVWTWSADHAVGFWQRMQAIEAAVHRWHREDAARLDVRGDRSLLDRYFVLVPPL